ncbi:MAG: acyltransferase [Sphingomicrobium sp.]
MKNPFDPGYYGSDELRGFGFKSVGDNVLVSKTCNIPRFDNIEIGDNVRIDAFTSIIAMSGYVRLGSYIHICIGCTIGARGGVEMEDFSTLSQGAIVLSASDDFGGEFMVNSTIPARFTNVKTAPVIIKRHSGLGAGSIALPGVTIGEGSAVGAQSLVTKSLEPWGVYFGCPVKRLKNRSRALLTHEAALLERGTVRAA